MIIADFLFDRETLKKFSKASIIAGILMVLVGALGIFAPTIMSLVVETFIGWLFITSAIIQGYITYKVYRKSFSAWLKPMLSLLVGIMSLMYPLAGIAGLALLLVSYLLIDAYASFGFAMEYKPNKGWWMLLVNSVISVVLAALIMVGWPVSSIFWVGLYAAISLLVDGITLVTLGVGAKKLVENR